MLVGNTNKSSYSGDKDGGRQYKYLTEEIVEGKWINAHVLHSLKLLIIKMLQLIHGEITISIQIHTPKPILYAVIQVKIVL